MEPHPLPPFLKVLELAHSPSPYVTGPHLAAQERILYSEYLGAQLKARDYMTQGKEAQTLGNNLQELPQFNLLSAQEPASCSDGNRNGGRDKSMQEDCDSKLITSVRAFLGWFSAYCIFGFIK